MTLTQHLLFLLCVALASLAQNLTGFAFGLILLGLVALLNLVSLADGANVVSVLVLANAALTFGAKRPKVEWPAFWPALMGSLAGVYIGVALLGWLSGQGVAMLRFLLGCAIIICAFLLIVHSKAKTLVSGTGSFLLFGGLSGVMGGLFASAGPPMVYHLYRQPWSPEMIRHSLILLFAANAALRLVLVVGGGDFSSSALMLAAEALPMVLLLTWLARRYPFNWPIERVRRVVFALLLVAGGSLILPGVFLFFKSNLKLT
jgi:uncharacterized membrane protein YfcA